MVCFDCTVVKACDVIEAVILDNAAVEGDSSCYRNDLAWTSKNEEQLIAYIERSS